MFVWSNHNFESNNLYSYINWVFLDFVVFCQSIRRFLLLLVYYRFSRSQSTSTMKEIASIIVSLLFSLSSLFINYTNLHSWFCFVMQKGGMGEISHIMKSFELTIDVSLLFTLSSLFINYIKIYPLIMMQLFLFFNTGRFWRRVGTHSCYFIINTNECM